MIDLRAASSESRPPEGADVLDERRLRSWLAENVGGFEGPLRILKFTGGQSNPTYRVDTGNSSYVLRRKPFGALLPSAHAVDREYRVLSGLHRLGYPVPRPRGLCTDDGVIGAWFYLMDLVPGRILWDASIPGASREERRASYESMVDTLAALHDIDVDAAGLREFGKPGNYFGRQIDRWTKQYRLAETDVVPDMEHLIEWLPKTLPEQSRSSLVHGDYRIDNLVFDPIAPRVIAVLDWELSTLGDPLADFTYFALAWVTDSAEHWGLSDLDRDRLGIPELPDIIERYCRAAGLTAMPDLNWYFAYNLFRMAAILQGVKKRSIDGTASSMHARQMAQKVAPLARRAHEFADQS